jgi:peptidoglycan/xylan/chitin deacetylase (PgdA/CDA1 family)
VDALIDALFDLTPEVRYVAVYDAGDLSMRQRPGIDQASAAESDRYEELLVNPTLLKLTAQRGDIDCGGLRYVVVRYGAFYQLVVPTNSGHVSIAFEPRDGPLSYTARIVDLLREHGLTT